MHAQMVDFPKGGTMDFYLSFHALFLLLKPLQHLVHDKVVEFYSQRLLPVEQHERRVGVLLEAVEQKEVRDRLGKGGGLPALDSEVHVVRALVHPCCSHGITPDFQVGGWVGQPGGRKWHRPILLGPS
jgi:hypothetical protein